MTKQEALPFYVLIPAAGNATRMGGQSLPKPYLKIGEQAVLRHTINRFLAIDGLQGIQVVIQDDHRDLYNEAVHGLNLPPPITGSNTRKSSVYNGLYSFSNVKNDDIILIHDAARPLVQKHDIENLIKTMKTGCHAATLATPVTDTLHRKDGQAIDREKLWAVQTPQAFRLKALLAAHEKFKGDNSFTDDIGLMHAMGHETTYVSGSSSNIKITTPQDFDMVTIMINTQNAAQNDTLTISVSRETRTAGGFDVHAFEAEQSQRPLMLGGVKIDHPLALCGHSDADVVLHAITDAILGTINEGDIGTHFPPSEAKWKDASSDIFLKHAVSLLHKQQGTITFLDVTIMAEEPKIGPHRDAIQHKIAEITGTTKERISIKATTTEKLGFTGRKEGIACQALATITLPAKDNTP